MVKIYWAGTNVRQHWFSRAVVRWILFPLDRTITTWRPCSLFGHKWDEFHCYDVVCPRCRSCRAYTLEDEENFKVKYY